ncbi:MAG: hypothetical protein RLN72_01175 [Henriciella sp.]|jgi:hypothetical protein|tara:strand:- start:7768 stop:7989 length:222 start_codon:yes stop_codon:yes gene_type:complete
MGNYEPSRQKEFRCEGICFHLLQIMFRLFTSSDEAYVVVEAERSVFQHMVPQLMGGREALYVEVTLRGNQHST